mmetsp:Transcript_3728/g.9055  ORF Transcript_3728/g.9055 Transcript_3728/m.9055 type:complete len:230 (-) Transcript_3728:1605-2294(-)
MSRSIVKTVPVAIVLVDGTGGVVSAAQSATVVHHGEEIVDGRRVFGRWTALSGREIPAFDRKLDESSDLLTKDRRVLKAFQMNDEYIWKTIEIELFVGLTELGTVSTVPRIILAEFLLGCKHIHTLFNRYRDVLVLGRVLWCQSDWTLPRSRVLEVHSDHLAMFEAKIRNSLEITSATSVILAGSTEESSGAHMRQCERKLVLLLLLLLLLCLVLSHRVLSHLILSHPV